MAALAERLEAAYAGGDSLACSNLAELVAQLFICSVLSGTTLFSFLRHLSARYALHSHPPAS